MIEDYDNAKKLGDRAVRSAMMRGAYPYLPALDDMLPLDEQTSVQSLGLSEIPISTIVGTKTSSRQNAFANNFMPILQNRSEFGMKWSNLYDSAIDEGIRDAITCYEYLYKFYVQEGNKRVSVSKYLDQTDILANVTRILPKKTDDPEIRLYYEFVEFYDVAPLYGIYFSKEGSYAKLAQALGQDLTHAWPSEVLEDLKTGYYAFEQVFAKKGGEKLGITAADAFLIYLQIYPLQRIANSSKSAYTTQIEKVWDEIVLASSREQVALLETPEEAPKENINILSRMLTNTAYTKENPLKVAFIYEKSPADSSWTYSHELGRAALEEKFDGAVDSICFNNCDTDEKIRKAIDAAVVDENRIIFTTSMNQMDETLRSAIHYPNVQFMNCSLNLAHSAVQSYYAKTYESKFLLGALAAAHADNHKIGYRASFPVAGAAADINAFAIGAAMIDPQVKIYLRWASAQTLDEWEEIVKKEEIRVVSGISMIRPKDASREYGVFRIEDDGSVTNLAASFWDWGKYYELILRSIVEGDTAVKISTQKDVSLNYWWGMSAGVIDIICSEKLSYYAKKTMDLLRNAVISGRLNPFDGELHSQNGIVKPAGSPRLSPEEIVSMDWLNDNVIGSIPSKEELITPVAKQAVEVSGILDK